MISAVKEAKRRSWVGKRRMAFIEGLRRIVAHFPGARALKRRLFGSEQPSLAPIPTRQPGDRGAPPRVDRSELSARYYNSSVSSAPDRFALYRIIGNDLPPLHARGQSRENLAFILENEPDLPRCEKRFVVNRIVDIRQERAVLQLLQNAGTNYIHIPFDIQEYQKLSWDRAGVPEEYAPGTQRFADLGEAEKGLIMMRLYRYKNNYVMNNNGARNAALKEGKKVAKWVLPWDGNCFLTRSAWDEIVSAVLAEPELPYFIVPMVRIANNGQLLGTDLRLEAAEEPQIIFRCDTTTEYDTEYCYGRRPKVEMLWRLGVPGDWDKWLLYPWDLPCPDYMAEAGAYGRAGWVARLSSGQSSLEQWVDDATDAEQRFKAADNRFFARLAAIKRMLDRLDDEVQMPRRKCNRPL